MPEYLADGELFRRLAWFVDEITTQPPRTRTAHNTGRNSSSALFGPLLRQRLAQGYDDITLSQAIARSGKAR